MKNASILIVIVSLVYFGCNNNLTKESKLSQNSYSPEWKSLVTHETPDWLLDAKFGIYAHWGLYSVPAFGNEWYGKLMYDTNSAIYNHHISKYGDPKVFGYKDFIPDFKAENYNPDEWADIIENSGAKFAGIALVHHDGFCLWDSKFTRWNSVEMGPGRDLYGDLVKSLRKKEDMKVIATFHHIRTFNWYLSLSKSGDEAFNNRKIEFFKEREWDIVDPVYASLYWNEGVDRKEEDFIVEWNHKVKEVIDKYSPDVIWFDGGKFQNEVNEPMVTDLLSYYYNKGLEQGKKVEVLNKLPVSLRYNFPVEIGVLTYEEGRDRPDKVPYPWIDDMKISDHSWGYVEGQTYKSPNTIIDGLVDRVSRGGGLLLSLCPLADGTINEEQKYILNEIGDWLKVNGEAIYGSREWKINAEGDETKFIKYMRKDKHPTWVFDNCNYQDIRFTTKDDVVYAIALGWPEDGVLKIKSLGADAKNLTESIDEIILLGCGNEIKWTQKPDELIINLPTEIPNEYAYVFRIDVKEVKEGA